MTRYCLLLVTLLTTACNSTEPTGGATPVETSTPEANGKLDKEAAKAILLKDIYGKGIARCDWRSVSKSTGRGPTFGDYDTTHKCGAQLERAGLIKRTDCLENGCGGCCKRFFEPSGAMSVEDGYYAFDCGKLELLEIVSITTKEPELNKAEVVFKRRFTPDAALMKSIDLCTISVPEEGEVEINRSFSRTDAGQWILNKAGK